LHAAAGPCGFPQCFFNFLRGQQKIEGDRDKEVTEQEGEPNEIHMKNIIF
jgi:hypothetical protein